MEMDPNPHDLCEQARSLCLTGDIKAAIERYEQALDSLYALGSEVIYRQTDLGRLLLACTDEIVGLLRWHRCYTQAIEAQKRLLDLYPDLAIPVRIGIANLKLEACEDESGLTELAGLAEATSDEPHVQIALGCGYMWMMRFAEAEKHLLLAARMEGAGNSDRAMAYKCLFDMYGTQERVEEATEAWERACKLDPAFKATLPELVRMLIYWYYYDMAEAYLEREPSVLRRIFYRRLIQFKQDYRSPVEAWSWVLEYEPNELHGAQEEFAEACIRLVLPARALEALEPLIDCDQATYYGYLLAALAWAQQRVVNRAQWALDIALRMADLCRPRRTRPDGEGRILDAASRILYGEIAIDADIREQLDSYFMPRR